MQTTIPCNYNTVMIMAQIPTQLLITLSLSICNYSKGKANPLQAWAGPEGSRKLRLPDFMTIGT